jgi:hypothetical protein
MGESPEWIAELGELLAGFVSLGRAPTASPCGAARTGAPRVATRWWRAPERRTVYPTCCGERSSRCAGQALSCAPLWAQKHSSGARRSRARLASVSLASRRPGKLFGALAACGEKKSRSNIDRLVGRLRFGLVGSGRHEISRLLGHAQTHGNQSHRHLAEGLRRAQELHRGAVTCLCVPLLRVRSSTRSLFHRPALSREASRGCSPGLGRSGSQHGSSSPGAGRLGAAATLGQLVS